MFMSQRLPSWALKCMMQLEQLSMKRRTPGACHGRSIRRYMLSMHACFKTADGDLKGTPSRNSHFILTGTLQTASQELQHHRTATEAGPDIVLCASAAGACGHRHIPCLCYHMWGIPAQHPAAWKPACRRANRATAYRSASDLHTPHCWYARAHDKHTFIDLVASRQYAVILRWK